MRALAIMGFIVLLGASAAMSSLFAYSIGIAHGPAGAWVFAIGAVALLLSESALAAGPKTPMRVSGLLVIAAAVLSLELGFSASTQSDATAQRADAGRRAARAAGVVEPAAVIELRIRTLKATHKGLSEAWCASRDQDDAATCKDWMALRTKHAAAEAVERSGPAPAIGEADARASLLSRYLPASADNTADMLALLMALAMSVARIMLAGSLARAPAAAAPVTPPVLPAIEPPAELAPVACAKAIALPVPAPEKKNVSAPAKRALRVIRAAGGDEQSFIGFLPPSEISQRRLATEAKLSRREVAKVLGELEAVGLIKVEPGKGGTGVRVLR